MMRDGESDDEPGYVTDVITDDALGFLEAAGRDRQRPSTSASTTPRRTARGSGTTTRRSSYDAYYADCPFDSCPRLPMHPWQINSRPAWPR